MGVFAVAQVWQHHPGWGLMGCFEGSSPSTSPSSVLSSAFSWEWFLGSW